jgi:hypothetical protein
MVFLEKDLDRGGQAGAVGEGRAAPLPPRKGIVCLNQPCKGEGRKMGAFGARIFHKNTGANLSAVAAPLGASASGYENALHPGMRDEAITGAAETGTLIQGLRFSSQ